MLKKRSEGRWLKAQAQHGMMKAIKCIFNNTLTLLGITLIVGILLALGGLMHLLEPAIPQPLYKPFLLGKLLILPSVSIVVGLWIMSLGLWDHTETKLEERVELSAQHLKTAKAQWRVEREADAIAQRCQKGGSVKNTQTRL